MIVVSLSLLVASLGDTVENAAAQTWIREGSVKTTHVHGIRSQVEFSPNLSLLHRKASGRTARLTLKNVPLAEDLEADFELTRFSVLKPGAQLVVVTPEGTKALTPPSRSYFTGHATGKPDSFAFFAVGPESFTGIVGMDGRTFVIGRNSSSHKASSHRVFALEDVDPSVYFPSRPLCLAHEYPSTLQVGTDPEERTPSDSKSITGGIRAAASGVVADLAVETDYEYFSLFASQNEAMEYASDLTAAASAIYERDLGVRLRLAYLRIWTTNTDPYGATSGYGALTEFQNYWNGSMTGVERDIAHMLSGRKLGGGIAYIGAVCSTYWCYGVVGNIDGDADFSNPATVWDLLAVSHEIGHNFGSAHTHCYTPPIDTCYNEESCYDGPEECSRGTIMSYCHLCGGYANVDMEFHQRVRDYIGNLTAGTFASCLEPMSAPSPNDAAKFTPVFLLLSDED